MTDSIRPILKLFPLSSADFYSGGVNGCNLRGPDSPSPCSGVDDLYSSPPPPSASSSDLSPPVATLCNLGNTCFLNSVLYTLRFAPSFLHNLHHLVNDINVVTSHTKMMKVSFCQEI
jgi:Ubiquitin carboxyl-terminal hydrolase.